VTALTLRPATEADAAFLDRLASPEVAGPFNTFPPDPDADPDDELRAADVGAGTAVAVLADGTPVADVSWFGAVYGPNRRSVAWKIGCTVDVPFRRRGYGSLAQRLLADHLFATTAAHRVEADTDVGNVAEQRALERAGFTREGVLRGAQYRAGSWHDLVLYSRLRDDR
jgi:RimJ/RimL family protein N-acetyltransferase